jgi:hypothetical protein
MQWIIPILFVGFRSSIQPTFDVLLNYAQINNGNGISNIEKQEPLISI